MSDCLIALGCNQGNCVKSLRAACDLICGLPQTSLVAASSAIRTKPVGMKDDSAEFLNAAARIQTELDVRELFLALAEIEQSMGRIRGKDMDRSIDLDLLLFDQTVLSDPNLQVPHPRMSFRRFVLEPAIEIAAEMTHPLCHMSIGELVKHLDTTPNLIWLVGADLSLDLSFDNDWSVKPVSQSGLAIQDDRAEVPKLYVRLDADEEAWDRLRGPKQDLSHLPKSRLTNELNAAIQAMRPLDTAHKATF